MGHRFDELPVVTTPSDSDKVVVEHDNLTSQITLARLIAAERARLNLLESKLEVIGAGSFNTIFANTSSITSQVDEFTVGSYTGTIASYGHQVATDVPADTNYYVEAFVYPNTNYRKIILHTLNSDASYTRYKYSDGTWSSWVLNPTRTEITNIGKRTEVVGDMVSTTTTFAYTGKSVTITKTSYVEAMLTYTNTPTDTIAILSESSGNSARFYAQQKNNDVGGITPSYICCGTVLPAGTYYIWAKSRSNGSNAIYIYVTQIEP